MHLLLVEDDADLGQLLRRYLIVQGLVVALAPDGEAALAQLATQAFDLVVLDVMLPKGDGFSLAAALKSRYPHLPFLFLTARRAQADVLTGLRLGADDYMLKPFDADELVLRVQNILRRSHPAGHPPEVLRLGDFHFEPTQLRLWHGPDSVLLTRKEAGVLALLARQPGRLVRRQQVLEELWDNADYFNGRSLDVYIGRLRKRLEADPALRLESVRGTGFILHLPPLG
jgi:DNA-binding response OmpR family regulator